MVKKMKCFIQKSKQCIPALIVILLSIIIIKQLGMYEKVATIYKAVLPIFMGSIIAFLLQPIIDRLQKRFTLRMSVSLVYIGIFLFLIVFLVIFMPVLYNQVLDFAKMIPSWIDWLESFLDSYQISFENLENMKQKYWQEGYVIVFDSLRNSAQVITKYVIAFITAFFISIDMDFWKHTAKKLIPDVHKFSTFYYTMSNIVYQYLIGTLADLVFISLSVGIVLSIGGFPNAVLYAILLALLNLFPYIGASIGLLLIGIVGLLSFSKFPVIIFIIIWVIQQVEANFIQPLIFNRMMHVRPILTFVFVFISEAFFGIAGVILSPIFAAIAQIAFRSYLHAKTNDTVGEWEDIWRDFDEVMEEEAKNENI